MCHQHIVGTWDHVKQVLQRGRSNGIRDYRRGLVRLAHGVTEVNVPCTNGWGLCSSPVWWGQDPTGTSHKCASTFSTQRCSAPSVSIFPSRLPSFPPPSCPPQVSFLVLSFHRKGTLWKSRGWQCHREKLVIFRQVPQVGSSQQNPGAASHLLPSPGAARVRTPSFPLSPCPEWNSKL